MYRKLDVFGQQIKRPSTHSIQCGLAEKKPCSGHSAAGAKLHPSAIQILAFAQKPERITGGNPVISIVFGVAITGNNLIALREGFIHMTNVIRGEDVVGVKNKVAIKAARIVCLNVRQ